MPIYEYACEKCGHEVDLLQKVSDPPPETCPKCEAKGSMVKRVSRSSFHLKGGGWYSDLYGSAKKDVGTAKESSTAAAAPAASTTSSSGTPAAPSTTTTATPASSASTPSSSGTSGGGSDKK